MTTFDVQSLSPAEVQVTGDERLQEWREAQRTAVPGAKYTPAYRKGRWDGFHRPGRWCRRTGPGVYQMRCSRGLLARLGASFNLHLPEDLAPRPLSPEDMNALRARETLRDYQTEAVVLGLTERWGRLALATNAGKGAVIALLSERLLARGRRVLILADEVAVFDALRGELEKWADLSPGAVESGVREPPGEDVALVMVPTLHRRLGDEVDAGRWRDWVGSFDAALLDEADKATSDSWGGILRAARNTRHRLGFSGSFPADPHGRLLMDELTGPVLLQKRNLELVERGVSARPVILLHPWDADLPPLPGDWRGRTGPERRRWVFEAAVVGSEARHRFLASLIRPGVPTCVIVERLDHGHALEDALPGARFLHGGISKGDRREALDAFEAGEFNVLVVTRILDRGTNRLGRAVDLIFASGAGSHRQTLQRIGRGLRRTDGKPFLVLRDVIDRAHPYLRKAARKRVALYGEEGFDVRIVR